MESFNIRNIYHIHRQKIVVLVLVLFCAGKVSGQALNKQFYEYDRFIHFGFTIGFNYSTLKYDFNPKYWPNHQNPADTILRVSAKGTAGFTLGAVCDLHLGSPKSFIRDHFDLRIIPTLCLTERDFYFTMSDQSVTQKQIESAFVDAPVLLKMKSDRFGNLRFYVIGGGEYSYDLSSTAGAAVNPADPKISIYPNNIAYQFGAGLDMYFPFFKFSPEIKISQGLNNVLVPQNTIYSNIFSRFRSNFIYFSLYFEG